MAQQILTTHFSEPDIRQIIADELEIYFKNNPLPLYLKVEPEVLLTKKQAANFLSVSHVTLNKLIQDGRLPCHRIGSTLRIKKTELLSSLITVRTKNFNKNLLGNSS